MNGKLIALAIVLVSLVVVGTILVWGFPNHSHQAKVVFENSLMNDYRLVNGTYSNNPFGSFGNNNPPGFTCLQQTAAYDNASFSVVFFNHTPKNSTIFAIDFGDGLPDYATLFIHQVTVNGTNFCYELVQYWGRT